MREVAKKVLTTKLNLFVMKINLFAMNWCKGLVEFALILSKLTSFNLISIYIYIYLFKLSAKLL